MSSKNNDPLKFGLKFESPDDPNIGNYIQCGITYNPKLMIESVKSNTFSHRGIDYEFCTELCNFDGTVAKYNVINKHLSDNSTINKSVCFDLPQIKTMPNAQTYHGGLFAIRHFIRVWVRKLFGNEFYEREIYAYKKVPFIKKVEPYNWVMIIGDTLRVNILTQRRKFDLNDVIMGSLHFIMVNIKIRMVRIQIVAQETLEVNGVSKKFKNIIDYWELAVGNPVKDEIIPFRLFLKPVNIHPSTSNVELGYSVTHFLHFTIITESGSKYFKALQVRFSKMDRLPFFFDGEDDEFVKKFQKEVLQQQTPQNPTKTDKSNRKLFLNTNEQGDNEQNQNEDAEPQEEEDEGAEIGNDENDENGDNDDNDQFEM